MTRTFEFYDATVTVVCPNDKALGDQEYPCVVDPHRSGSEVRRYTIRDAGARSAASEAFFRWAKEYRASRTLNDLFCPAL